MALTGFFRNNALVGVAEIFCRLPLIFSAGYMARVLGTSVYGNWILILVMQNLFVGIASLGLSSSVSRLASVCSSGQATSYLLWGLRTGATAILGILAVTLVMQAEIGSSLNLSAEFHWLLPIAAAVSITTVAESLLNAYFKARGLIRRQFMFLLARTLVEVTTVFAVFGLIAPRADIEVPQILLIYLAALLLLKLTTYPWLVTGDLSRREFITVAQRREFFRYGLSIIPTLLVSWVVGQGDRLVLGQLISAHELGIYAFGANLANYISYLGYVVYPLLLPQASRLYDGGDRVGLRELFQSSQHIYLLLLTLALATIALFSREMILLTAGPAYSEAAPIVFILSVAIGFENYFGIYQYTFNLIKQTHLLFWYNLTYGVLIVAFVYVAGLIWGVSIVPWAVLAAVLTSNALLYLIAQKYLAIPLPWLTFAATVAILAGAFALHICCASLDLLVRLGILTLCTVVILIKVKNFIVG